jgi:hypothetical protein
MPSLGLNSQKKQVPHIANLHYYVYGKKKVISETFITTKEKLDIVALKSLIALISSCQNKREIKSILEKK